MVETQVRIALMAHHHLPEVAVPLIGALLQIGVRGVINLHEPLLHEPAPIEDLHLEIPEVLEVTAVAVVLQEAVEAIEVPEVRQEALEVTEVQEVVLQEVQVVIEALEVLVGPRALAGLQVQAQDLRRLAEVAEDKFQKII